MAINAFDKKQIQEQIRAEKDIDALLRSLAQELKKDINSKYRDDEQVRNLDALVAAFAVSITKFWDEIESVIYERSGNVADVTIDKNKKLFLDYMKKVKKAATPAQAKKVAAITDKAVKEFDYFKQRNENITKARQVFDDKTIGQRIKIVKGATKKTVQNIVAVGVEKGKSAREIAKDIDGYVNPIKGNYKSPFDYYRQRFDKKTISQSVKKAGYVREGSVSYQAQRIARTEINMTQREVTSRLYKKVPFVKGFNWNLSLSHPDLGCECEKLSKTNPHKAVPETPHPNCMCYVTTELIDPKTFLKTFK